jgi:hypothetical protein
MHKKLFKMLVENNNGLFNKTADPGDSHRFLTAVLFFLAG